MKRVVYTCDRCKKEITDHAVKPMFIIECLAAESTEEIKTDNVHLCPACAKQIVDDISGKLAQEVKQTGKENVVNEQDTVEEINSRNGVITKDKLEKMYADMSVSEIAHKLDVTESTVHNYIKKLGIALKRPRKKIAVSVDGVEQKGMDKLMSDRGKVRSLRRAGWSVKQIAEEFGTNEITTSMFMRNNTIL